MKVLSVVAPHDFQDKEYGDSRAALELAGHKVYVVSTEFEVQGKYGLDIIADFILGDIQIDEFDAVMFIGGAGCEDYFDYDPALNLAKDFYNSGKITAAICAAPVILANAGILEGKKSTCWQGSVETIKEKGADYTGSPVEQDGLIITADGPGSATAFGRKIAENLG